MKIKFSTVTYFDKPVESKTQFTKYLINVHCGKQQIYAFWSWSKLQCQIPALTKTQEFNVTMQ